MSGAGIKDETGSDPYADAGNRYGRLTLPQIDPSLQIGALQTRPRAEPEYLKYNIKGRDVWEKVTYNTGAMYLIGITTGGLYGVRMGLKKAPSNRRRIKMNSALNFSAKHGSKVSNTLGVLAMFYTAYEHFLDKYQVDEQIGLGRHSEVVNPVLAGSLTGLTFRMTAKPRVMAMAGVVGGVLAGTAAIGSSIYNSMGRPSRSYY